DREQVGRDIRSWPTVCLQPAPNLDRLSYRALFLLPLQWRANHHSIALRSIRLRLGLDWDRGVSTRYRPRWAALAVVRRDHCYRRRACDRGVGGASHRHDRVWRSDHSPTQSGTLVGPYGLLHDAQFMDFVTADRRDESGQLGVAPPGASLSVTDDALIEQKISASSPKGDIRHTQSAD